MALIISDLIANHQWHRCYPWLDLFLLVVAVAFAQGFNFLRAFGG
jgi:hypothetical protein